MSKHLGKFIIDNNISPVDDCEKTSSDVMTNMIKNLIFCFQSVKLL